MVSWFHPIEIVRTAVRVLLASEIARYVDRRESQASLPKVGSSYGEYETAAGEARKLGFDADFSDKDTVWIDYVADAGDGWNATYTTAMFVGQEKLSVDGLSEQLDRANLLVFGGDNVYPTPSPQAYNDRLARPFEAAFPGPSEALSGQPAKKPLLFAIPGNHDWYDGLTSFLRVFCRGRSFGAWQTKQTRSYFSVKLPAGWMIWGCDIQLDTEPDSVQLAHFIDLTKDNGEPDAANPNKKNRIILCTAKPAWIREMHRDPLAYKNYWSFLDHIRKAKGTVEVSIAGDLHHYIRYTTRSGRHQITAGGGGSFLRGTHDMPNACNPPNLTTDGLAVEGETETYLDSGSAFPSRTESRRLAVGALKFPLLRRSWLFCALLGLVYFMLFWSLGRLSPDATMSDLQSAVTTAHSMSGGLEGLVDYVGRLLSAIVVRPSAAMVPLVVLLLFGAFCSLANHRSRIAVRWSWGVGHGLIHLSFAILIASLVVKLAASRFGSDFLVWETWQLFSVYAAIVAVGGVVGGMLMGLYLVLSDALVTLHTNEAFSAQALPDYRCFLRMKVEQSGRLTIYPIGVRRAPRTWRRKLDRVEGEAYFGPHGEMPRAHLIEGPIFVR